MDDEVLGYGVQRCSDEGESYSASYLVTRYHFLGRNLHYNNSNTELASFVMMDTVKQADKKIRKNIVQSTDFLDFGVIHLSAYERTLTQFTMGLYNSAISTRSMRREGKSLVDQSVAWEMNRLVSKFRHQFATIPMTSSKYKKTTIRSSKLDQTLAILPFYGVSKAASHTDGSHRLLYLQACVYKLRTMFKYIVIGVNNEIDYNAIVKDLQLPIMKTILLSDIENHAEHIPMASLQAVQNYIRNNKKNDCLNEDPLKDISETYINWQRFKYIFYTESDQVIVSKRPFLYDFTSSAIPSKDPIAYKFLDTHPSTVMIPHRFIPYPRGVLDAYQVHTSMVSPASIHECTCMASADTCQGNRHQGWAHFSHKNVSYLKIHGLFVAMGNGNFKKHLYRPCSLQRKRVDAWNSNT
jgi:hypothetical protein